MNELLFIITIIANYIGILIFYKIYKKTGVFIWLAFSTILANIETIKNIDLFGVTMTLGNIIYCTSFLATDILNEIYGEKDAKKGILVGFSTMICFTLYTQIDLMFIPSATDFSSEALKTVFGLTPRICFASMLTYVISNYIDVNIFTRIKRRFPEDKYYILRKNGSNLISQFVDSFLFTAIAFVGVYSLPVVIELSLTTYIVKMLISVTDVPFMKIAKKIEKTEKFLEE